MKSKLLILLAAAAFLTGCALFKGGQPDESKEKPLVEAPTLVGRIASIPADKRFVLIQSFGKWTIEAGTILTTRGNDGRTANLRVTGETLGQFAAADLQSGSVEIGDAVYSRHVPKPPPSPPPSPAQAVPAGSPPTPPTPVQDLELPENQLPTNP